VSVARTLHMMVFILQAMMLRCMWPVQVVKATHSGHVLVELYKSTQL
jgi:hypothetical protein